METDRKSIGANGCFTKMLGQYLHEALLMNMFFVAFVSPSGVCLILCFMLQNHPVPKTAKRYTKSNRQH